MLLDKRKIFSLLQAKADKILKKYRADIARNLFEHAINEEMYFIFNKKTKEVIEGPFPTKEQAKAYIKRELDNSDDYLALCKDTIEKILKEKI